MRLKSLAVLVALPVIMVSCGGKDNGSSGDAVVGPGSNINSQFIDAPVKGLKISRQISGAGETGANGIFTCSAGEMVEFWLKEVGGTGLMLGKANCGEKVYIDDLGADAVKAGALIQSLSTGDHATRKELDLSAFNGTAVNVSTITLSSVDDTAINTLVGNSELSALGVTAVTLTQARTHMDANLPDLKDDALDDIAAATAGGKMITLDAVGTLSNDCWDKVSAKIEVTAAPYKFKILKYIGHDTAVDPNTVQDVDCHAGSEGDDRGTEGAEFYCWNNPLATKVMTGRTLNFMNLFTDNFKADAGAAIVCLYEDGEYGQIKGEETCEGGTILKTDKAYDVDLNYGITYKLAITDAGYTVEYVENNSDFEPDSSTLNQASETIGFKTTSTVCRYGTQGSFN